MIPAAAAIVLAAASVPGIPWTEDPSAALKQAAERRIPVLVDVWAVWCVPCKKMDETTYRDPRVVETAARVVPLKVDADAQPIFVERYRVQAYPEVLFLDHEGKEIARESGFLDAERLLRTAGRVLDGYPGYLAWVEGDGSAETALAAGEMLLSVGGGERGRRALLDAAKDVGRLEETGRLRLGRALVGADEEKRGAAILHELGTRAESREVQEAALRTLAGLQDSRATRSLAEAARERLRREFGD